MLATNWLQWSYFYSSVWQVLDAIEVCLIYICLLILKICLNITEYLFNSNEKSLIIESTYVFFFSRKNS